MDFTMSHEQRMLVNALDAISAKYAGPRRAQQVLDGDGYDDELVTVLGESGFLDLAASTDGGPVEATLAVIALAKALGTFNLAERLLVGPLVLGGDAPDSVVLIHELDQSPVRYGSRAEAALLVASDEARLVPLDRSASEPVKTIFGYPYARVRPADSGRSLGPGSAARVRRLWRLALASEMVGAMVGARELTLRYVADRHQFGRSIGSFQAIQHRMTEAYISIEGARWLTLAAAWRGDDESAQIAAGYATRTAGVVVREMHQLTGAIGLTNEYDLRLWTLRLEALRTELGGETGHYEAFTKHRWGDPALHEPQLESA